MAMGKHCWGEGGTRWEGLDAEVPKLFIGQPVVKKAVTVRVNIGTWECNEWLEIFDG